MIFLRIVPYFHIVNKGQNISINLIVVIIADIIELESEVLEDFITSQVEF